MSETVQIVSAQDERLSWNGAVSLEKTDEWVRPWRLPHEDKNLFPPEALIERAGMPAGVRLCFATDSKAVRLNVTPMAAAGKIDVVCNGDPIETVPFAQGDTAIAAGALPEGRKEIALWLPMAVPVQLASVEIDARASLERTADTRPKWITYGSSISHCGGAESPAYTWPGIVARECGLNLTCLGFGGNCHLEPNLARLIRDLPADYISLKVGINVMGGASLGPRTFLPAVIGFVLIVREGHPETPLVLCSPIISKPRETTDNAAGLNLVKMRGYIQEAVDIFQARGDKNIHYVDGLSLLGPDHAHLQADDCHPNAEGYKVLGNNFVREAASKYFV
ncbi:MAG: GDSL family lipase [Planctomycetes bacterium]|nr:GDSL family lipase [Planctomycetota bacterium]